MNGKLISRFNQLVMRYHRIIQLFFGVIAFLVLSYYLLQINGFPIRYINTTTLHKMILASVEIFLVVFFYLRFLRAGKSTEAKLNVVLLFLISNTLFFQPFLVYYFGSDLISLPNIRKLIPFSLISYYFLMGSTTIFLVILAHRRMKLYLANNPGKFKSFRELVDQTFAPSKERVITASQLQDKKLNNLVTSLSNIPLFGNMLRSIIKIGLAESAILLLFVLVGFGLRLWNLEQIPPYIDEFSHLNAAKQLFLGTPFDEITYRRGIYIVTFPIYLSYLTFGMSLWAARFVGVIFNMLAIIPLFYIGKRINKPIALIAVGLYLTNPWMISIARNVREYAYFPFYFYLVSFLILRLIENLPSKFIIVKDYKYFLSKKNLFANALLLLIIYKIAFISSPGTLPIIGLTYIAFALVFLSRIDYKVRSNIIIIITSGFLVSIFAELSELVLRIEYFVTPPKFDNYFLLLLFSNPEQQWYYDRLPYIGIMLSIIALLASFIYGKLNAAVSFVTLNFVIYLIFFSMMFNRYHKPRYGSIIEFWYVLVIAMGLYLVYKYTNNKLNNKYSIVVALIIFLAFFNWNQVVLPSVYTQSGSHPITNEYHYETIPVEGLLADEMKVGDVLVSTFSQYYLSFSAPFTFENKFQYIYYQSASAQMIYDTIAEYPSGWVILDVNRGLKWSQPLPLESIDHAQRSLEYLGLWGDYLVYRWGAD